MQKDLMYDGKIKVKVRGVIKSQKVVRKLRNSFKTSNSVLLSSIGRLNHMRN